MYEDAKGIDTAPASVTAPENVAAPENSAASEIRLRCQVCPHGCELKEGQTGRCRARGVRNGQLVSLNYGILTSLADDPIEKKPLRRFFPGSRILSAGSFGCNLNCPFCQNWSISMSDGREYLDPPELQTDPSWEAQHNYVSPERLAAFAYQLRESGNIGVAFTYNEPLISYEYVRDTAKLLKEKKLATILVTNGCVNAEIADEVLPLTDALNIDLKSFRPEIYRDLLGGDLETVKNFIRKAVELCHVELTSLIVPGMNDSEEEMREMCSWIASLPGGSEIPLHVSRFFPRYHMQDRPATEKSKVLRLAEVAAEQLKYVYPGNI